MTPLKRSRWRQSSENCLMTKRDFETSASEHWRDQLQMFSLLTSRHTHCLLGSAGLFPIDGLNQRFRIFVFLISDQRLLNQSSSTPMNSVFQFFENNAIPPPTPRLRQHHESDDSDDFVEVAIPKVTIFRLFWIEIIYLFWILISLLKVKFVADKDLNEIKSLLDELVDFVVNM